MTTAIISILGAITILTGLIIISVNVYFLSQNSRTKNWAPTTGTIILSDVEINKNPTKEKFEDYFRASVKYRYTVNGDEFISDRVCFGGNLFSPDQSKAKKTVNNYPVGRMINVHYNPEDHKEAILEQGYKSSQTINIIIAILVVVIGIFVILNRANIEQLMLGLN